RVFGPDPVRVPNVIPAHTFAVSGVRVTSMQITTVLTAVLIMLALRYYVYRTRWGRATRAVAEKPDVAAACGVNVNLVSQLTVSIASVMAGAAGVTLGLLYSSAAPFMGLLFGLKSFVCMLVAGNRYIEAIMAVGLLLGVVEAMVTGYVSSNLRDAVAFALLLAVLTTNFDWPFLVALLAGVLVGFLTGMLLALVTLRMNELVAGLTTLAFGETMVIIAFNLDYIGGANGFIGIPLETTFAAVYLLLALVVFIAWRFDRSRLGYAARACRDNVHAAEVMGINTAWVKTWV